ncbi:alpha,alpha-trehalase [Coxiella-like endosymbiont of Rhipicephalus sanguineus]|uniref:alpha,alpha-trehalase n=1 Tax=Coxiella-like endosymbiont of Rhipicephalus sanguineus TaxID=1955402 RepID=UPI00203FBBE1|nr:alpha,alpha-trehalase [Coxiella-like endosymbiont of Rhipicephalus sanguineus]
MIIAGAKRKDRQFIHYSSCFSFILQISFLTSSHSYYSQIVKLFPLRGWVNYYFTESNQQWDKPNGYPLHWIVIKGLLNYGFKTQAKIIIERRFILKPFSISTHSKNYGEI